jgi:hypothetical protein
VEYDENTLEIREISKDKYERRLHDYQSLKEQTVKGKTQEDIEKVIGSKNRNHTPRSDDVGYTGEQT